MANNNHFNLTLDTLAPSGSLSTSASVANANITLTHTYGNANLRCAWTDAVATPTVTNYATNTAYSVGAILQNNSDIYKVTTAITAAENTGFSAISTKVSQINWVAAATAVTSEFSAQGNQYVHMILKDAVNNMSSVYNAGPIFYDNVPPVITSVTLSDPDTGSTTITKSKTVKIAIVWSDATPSSNIVTATLTGTCLTGGSQSLTIASQTGYTGDLAFKTDISDAPYNVTLKITDGAGNVSTEKTSNTITLDTGVGTVVASLFEKDGTTSLPDYISYSATASPSFSDRKIKVKISCADTDLVGYKAWCNGNTEPDYTTQAAGKVDAMVEITLTANDGAKTVYAKVKDAAGNEKLSNGVTVTVDSVAPALSIAASKHAISSKTGYTDSTLTLSASDSPAGIKAWDLLCGSTSIKGSATSVPSTFTLNKATAGTAMVEGNNTIKLTATDNAGNTAEKTVVVKYDSTAPVVEIDDLTGTSNGYYKEKFDFDINITEIGAGFNLGSGEYSGQALYAWTSLTASDETAQGSNLGVSAAGTRSLTAANVTGTPTDSNTNYIHIKIVDAVGNIGYAHAIYKFDATAPAVDNSVTKFNSSTYTSTSAVATIQATDNLSGMDKMKIEVCMDGSTWKNLVSTNEGWEAYATSRNITLEGSDGIKKFRVTVKDKAGNVSAVSNVFTTELDTTKPSGSLKLYKTGTSEELSGKWNQRTFDAQITGFDDGSTGAKATSYKLYGDFTTASDMWIDLTSTTIKVNGLQCTAASPEVKTIKLKLKDNAGNESDEITATFTYDNSLPEVNISGLDHQIISKVHTYRDIHISGDTCQRSDCYADETKFTFTPSEEIIAYKVCAYVDAADARDGYEAATDKNAWVDTQVAIPTTGGSTNMTGTPASSTAAVNCMIRGIDYEAALVERGLVAGGTAEGAHIVVVYVKDSAGNWSAAAAFEA